MGRGRAPAREISFVSLMAYGPEVSDSALTIEGLQLLKPGRAVPNNLSFIFERNLPMYDHLKKPQIELN